MPDTTQSVFGQFKESIESSVEDVRTGFQDLIKSGAKTFSETRDDLLDTPFPFAPSINEQMKALRELFEFPEELSVGQGALGFGPLNIGKVPPGIFGGRNPKGFSKRLPSVKIKGEELFGEGAEQQALIAKQSREIAKTGQENNPIAGRRVTIDEEGNTAKTFVPNIGGKKPSEEVLFTKALEAVEQKAITTEVANIQKALDKKLIKEVKSGTQPNHLQKTKTLGIKKFTAGFNKRAGPEGRFMVAFRSDPKSIENPEFVVAEILEGTEKLFKRYRLIVDFNSRLIKPELAPVFRQQFPDNHVEDLIGDPSFPPEFSQTPPDNLSVFRIETFEDATIMINKMLELVKESK